MTMEIIGNRVIIVNLKTLLVIIMESTTVTSAGFHCNYSACIDCCTIKTNIYIYTLSLVCKCRSKEINTRDTSYNINTMAIFSVLLYMHITLFETFHRAMVE